MLFKDSTAFNAKTGVCYEPENMQDDGDKYTYNDFLEIAKGNDKLAGIIFDLCDWQHPETIFHELLEEGEIDENGNIF